MVNIDIDKQIIELGKEYKRINERLENVESELEELESEHDCLCSRIDGIESEIKNLKQKMLNEKIKELDIKTEEPFLKDFIIASYFCNRNEDSRPELNYVNITNNELQAVDGMKAIIIRNSSIPDSLKNTKIKWDVRENFENNNGENIESFIEIHKVFPPKNEYTFAIGEISVEDFYKKLKVNSYSNEPYLEIVTIETDRKIGVNKEYLDTALLAFKGEKFSLKSISAVSPLLLENERKSVSEQFNNRFYE